MNALTVKAPETIYANGEYGDTIYCTSAEQCRAEEFALEEGFGKSVDIEWQEYQLVDADLLVYRRTWVSTMDSKHWKNVEFAVWTGEKLHNYHHYRTQLARASNEWLAAMQSDYVENFV